MQRPSAAGRGASAQPVAFAMPAAMPAAVPNLAAVAAALGEEARPPRMVRLTIWLAAGDMAQLEQVAAAAGVGRAAMARALIRTGLRAIAEQPQ